MFCRNLFLSGSTAVLFGLARCDHADKLPPAVVYTVKRAPAEVKDGSSLALQLCHDGAAPTRPAFLPPLELHHLRSWSQRFSEEAVTSVPGEPVSHPCVRNLALSDIFLPSLSSADIAEAFPRTA